MSIVAVKGVALRCDKCRRIGVAALVPFGLRHVEPTTLPPPSRYEAHRAGWVMVGREDRCPECVPSREVST